MRTQKRTDYISWDYLFMSIAFMNALRSKDPSTRHGAVIVDPKTNHIISTGYNGFPLICKINNGDYIVNNNDEIFTWDRDELTPNNKNDYVIHAEINAILNATQSVKDCILFLYSEKLYLPCKECMKIIVQSGINEIIVNGLPSGNTDVYNWEPTKYMIQQSGIQVGVINDPIGMFRKIKEEADKAVIMYEKAVDKGTGPKDSYKSLSLEDLSSLKK